MHARTWPAARAHGAQQRHVQLCKDTAAAQQHHSGAVAQGCEQPPTPTPTPPDGQALHTQQAAGKGRARGQTGRRAAATKLAQVKTGSNKPKCLLTGRSGGFPPNTR
jgi:hypothetical protein